MTGTSNSLNNLDLGSFSFRWHLGLDCEDEDESVSDYGTVLHTGEANLSAPLTAATGLSAVEEITEGALTDSRTASTTHWLSPNMTPSDNEFGLLPPQDRKDFEVTKASKNILGRLWSISDRLVPRLSILVHTPPAAKVQVDSSQKPPAALHPRPKNKLRKKTRPSIAITLAVEPASSFSLAQPLPRSLEALQAGASPVSISPVAAFSSARSFLSFQLPPVFSRARSKVLQKSTYGPSNNTGVISRTSTMDRPDVGSSGIQTPKSRGRVSRNIRSAKNSERSEPIDDDGIGGFPTPVRPASHRDRRGGSREETPARVRPGRISTSWELGLGLGQDLRLRVCSLWRVRGV